MEATSRDAAAERVEEQWAEITSREELEALRASLLHLLAELRSTAEALRTACRITGIGSSPNKLDSDRARSAVADDLANVHGSPP
jgi:hypothetical protein